MNTNEQAGRKRPWRPALRVLLSVAILALVGWYFSKLNLSEAWAALKNADYFLVAVAAFINMAVHLPAKSVRWWLMLAPMKRLPQLRVYNYLVAGYAASNILPARMGEVVRIVFVNRDGVPATGAAAVAVLEKVYEFVGMQAIILPLPFVLPALPVEARRLIPLIVIGGIVGAGVMLWLARHGKKKTGSFLARLGEGMSLLHEPRRAAFALALSVFVWCIDAASVVLVMEAVGIAPSFWAAAFVLLGLNLIIALPSTPAQLGLFEGAIVKSFELLGTSQERALAFAVLYHFMQIVPVTAYGGLMLLHYGVPREKTAAASSV